MGKVIIIKNGNYDEKIHYFAEESYIEENEDIKTRYYNTKDGSDNENFVIELKDNLNKNAIVLMITYESIDFEKIKDVYIGDGVEITDKNGIGYKMRVYLDNSSQKRVIESILDKLDLDIKADFGDGQFVKTSDMESLYQELKERILACKKEETYTDIENSGYTAVAYNMCKLAQKDERAVRIYRNEELGEYRSEFQRDRERVVNCKAFRRLVDKAQIFGSEKGDYYRTRMTHSLEVNQIAKAIAYALRLNMDLTEAIALGHDLGHTPFGHQGERTLDDILSGKVAAGIEGLSDLNNPSELFKRRCFGGFKHNYQSAKIISQIEAKYEKFPGLNVSVQVVEGVLKHTKLNPDIEIADFLTKDYKEKIKLVDGCVQVCSSLEGQVVAIADEIAQRGHDVDDALTSEVMSIEELLDRLVIDKCGELRERIENVLKEVDNSTRNIADRKELKIARIVTTIVDYFINDTIVNSLEKIKQIEKKLDEITLDNDIVVIEFSPNVDRVNKYLEKIVQKKVICNYEVARADYNASIVIQTLFEKYYKNPRLLHAGTVHKLFIETLNHPNKAVSNSAILLSDASVKIVNAEIEQITSISENTEKIVNYYSRNRDYSCNDPDIISFEKKRILIRVITDYIAGMTDGYALDEYNKLM